MNNRLKEYREKVGITQTELSKISGISRPTIIKIESGEEVELKTGTLVKLAEALNEKVGDIFF